MKATVIWHGVFDVKINEKHVNLLKNKANVCECVSNVCYTSATVIWGSVLDAKINQRQGIVLKTEIKKLLIIF